MPSRFIASSLSLVFYSAVAMGVLAAGPQSPKPSPTPSSKPAVQSTPQATTAGACTDQALVLTAAQRGRGEDERVKACAETPERDHSKAVQPTLPAPQEHLAQAQRIQRDVK